MFRTGLLTVVIVATTGLVTRCEAQKSAEGWASSVFGIFWTAYCAEPLQDNSSKSDLNAPDRSCMLEIIFDGDINEQTVNAVKRILSYSDLSLAKLPGMTVRYRVLLNSPGGSVPLAIDLGRILRARSVEAHVTSESICVSACVLLLVGARVRVVDGKIGIHRPFLDFDNHARDPTYTEVQRAINVARDQIVDYSSEMNVPRNFVDDMMLISPEQVQWLDHRRLAQYGIFAVDPIDIESDDIVTAKQFGLSRVEYMNRKATVLRQCHMQPDPDPFINFSSARVFSNIDCARNIMSAPVMP